MLKNKKILIAVLVAVVAIVATIFTFFQRNLGGASGGTVAYVDTISNIMGFSSGGNDRYSGVVESQQSVKVNKNQEKKIEQVFVSVGDQVIPTTVLFRYDVSEAQKQISSINLEIESLNGTITDKNKAISDARNDGINVEQISIFENEINKFLYLFSQIKNYKATDNTLDEYEFQNNEISFEAFKKEVFGYS